MGTKHFDDHNRSCLAQLRKFVATAGFLISIIISLISMGPSPVFAVDNLIDHFIDSNPSKGHFPVFVFPDLYITYWGSAWQNGFSTNGVPSSQYQAYLESYLNSMCNSQWLLTQMQYRFAGCVPNRVVGTWIDSNNPPKQTPTSPDIYQEVKKSILHFQGIYPGDSNAITIIVLAPGFGDTGFTAKGGGACAWHSMVDYRAFIVHPFQSDAPKGCRQFAVNFSPGDGFGHGVFDGDSLSIGHELAETLTDPDMNGAWYGISGLKAETGDKCNSIYADFSAGGNYYATQALWSNSDGKCVFGGTPLLDQTPVFNDFSNVVLYNSSSPITITVSNIGNLNARVTYNAYITGANQYDFELSGDTCIGGTPLPPGGSCKFDVLFRPTALGPRQAQVQIEAFDPLGQQIATPSTTIRGTGNPQWAVVDQGIVVFGGKLINSSGDSAPHNLNLTNQGDTPRLIQPVGLGGPNPSEFSILRDDCGNHELRPSESCAVVLNFMPTATGERRAEMKFTDAAGTVFGVPVLGTGLGPVAQLSAIDLSFGDATYNGDGAATSGEIPVSGEVHEITFTNTGQSPLAVNGVEVTGDFALNGNGCAHPLLPNDSCVIQVRLAPTHFQAQSGALMIYDNSSNSPHKVNLTGSVIAPIRSFAPDEVQFEPVPVGNMSGPQTVRLENLEGFVALHIKSIMATGDFTAASDCPSDLLIGSCSITVTMKPTATGPLRGMLLVTDNAPRSPQQIPLIGIGLPGNCNDKNKGNNKDKGKGHDKGKCKGHDKD